MKAVDDAVATVVMRRELPGSMIESRLDALETNALEARDSKYVPWLVVVEPVNAKEFEVVLEPDFKFTGVEAVPFTVTVGFK